MASSQPTTQKEKPILIGVIGIALILLLSIGWPTLQKHLRQWNLLPQTQQITELYFTNPSALPAVYQPGLKQQVTFTVHNETDTAENTSYVITQTNEQKSASTTLAHGSVNLAPGATQTIRTTVALQNFGTRSSVTIGLSQPKESISYWIDRSAS